LRQTQGLRGGFQERLASAIARAISAASSKRCPFKASQRKVFHPGSIRLSQGGLGGLKQKTEAWVGYSHHQQTIIKPDFRAIHDQMDRSPIGCRAQQPQRCTVMPVPYPHRRIVPETAQAPLQAQCLGADGQFAGKVAQIQAASPIQTSQPPDPIFPLTATHDQSQHWQRSCQIRYHSGMGNSLLSPGMCFRQIQFTPG